LNKLIIAALIGLLIFTACDEDTKNDAKEDVLPTSVKSGDNIINLSEINISGIKIKDLDTDQDSILIKDGIIREFCDYIKGLKLTKTDEPWPLDYETEILVAGESVLKISFSGRSVEFNEKVILENTVLERGSYEVGDWISENIKYFYEGKVLDPQNIEGPASIHLPEAEFKLDIFDKGNAKINQLEVYPKLYDFVKESFCNRQLEIVGYKRIHDYKLMEQHKRSAMDNTRAIVIENFGDYIKVDSIGGYDEVISASNIVLSANQKNLGIYQFYTDKAIIDIEVDNVISRGFEDVFSTNEKVSKDLTPYDIEVLFDKREAHYIDFICKNLGIENWDGRQPTSLGKSKISMNNQGGSYTVLELCNDIDLRLLFFKEDKFIDYIDYGGRVAGTDYRLEKAGDKVFVVGKSCRGHGTGESRYFEDWYTLTDKAKKLVVSLPYDDFIQGPVEGYSLQAKGIKLNANKDISLTANYQLKKFYLPIIDIGNESSGLTVEVAKKVVFKWDEGKNIFVSEFAPNDAGITEVTPESEEITRKCTDILKNEYKKLTEAMLLLDEEVHENIIQYMKRSWELFLNDCEDCDEKAALLKMLYENY